MFVLPLLTLAADGIKPDHNHVNESPFWTDLLAMLGAIGCIVSSIITLLVRAFFGSCRGSCCRWYEDTASTVILSSRR